MVRSLKGSSLPLALVVSALVALAAWAALVGPAHAAANSVTAGDATVAPAESGSVDITADAPSADLGAWEIDVAYDPAVISVDSCDAGSVGLNLCNEAFASDTVRVVGADAGGASGALTLATINFTALGAAGTCTDLTVTVNQFADPEGSETSPTVTNGKVCIEEPATPTPEPTAAPTDTPAPTPAGLPDTGGAPTSGSSDTVAYLLGALGLAVIAGGAFVVSRMRGTAI